MTVSTASGVPTPSITAKMASLIIGIRMRFETNPGASFTTITVLPSFRPNATVVATTSGAVCGVTITSSSGILCTGEKKCIPTTRDASRDAAADAFRAVRAKVDDFFTRVQLAAGLALVVFFLLPLYLLLRLHPLLGGEQRHPLDVDRPLERGHHLGVDDVLVNLHGPFGLRALRADVLISVSCPQIFKKPLIELPPQGILNIHGAILPQHRLPGCRGLDLRPGLDAGVAPLLLPVREIEQAPLERRAADVGDENLHNAECRLRSAE